MTAFVFIGGVSAIVFILGIFVFITKEGLGFILETLDLKEFFGSIAWRPTSNNPTYGALGLIVGTASVTGLAMLVSVPFSLGAAVFIGEFATGRTREVLKILVELLAASPHPAETLQRTLMTEKMTRDPDLWEAVIEEETLLQTTAEMLIEELSEDQLKRLSAKLKNLMG